MHGSLKFLSCKIFRCSELCYCSGKALQSQQKQKQSVGSISQKNDFFEKLAKLKKPYGGVLFYWFEFWRIYKYSYILLKTWERLLLTKKKTVHSVPNICNNKFISVICATIIVKARILFCNFCQLFTEFLTFIALCSSWSFMKNLRFMSSQGTSI